MTSGVGTSSDCVMYFQCTNYLVIASKLIDLDQSLNITHTHMHAYCIHKHTNLKL